MEGLSAVIDRWIDQHEQVILDHLRALLRIPSVCGEAEPCAPFGAQVRRALFYTLKLCRSLGFETVDMDGMIGYAEYGTGNEILGILCHLDVVPADGEWSCDPFAAEISGGKIIARGIQDDKGPAIAAIFGLAALKDAGITFRRKVRLLFGCDEESGMRCLQHYLASGEKIPDLSFSPDADFPVVNGELHICSAQYAKIFDSSLKIQAGVVANAVPATAEAIVPITCKTAVLPTPEGFTVNAEPCYDGTKITVIGKAAHASTPHLGKNAIQAMLYLLEHLPLPDTDLRAVRELTRVFGMDYYGQKLGLDVRDASGRLTLNLGMLCWNENGYRLDLDIRAPISLDEETIRSRVQKALNGFCIERSFHFSRGFYLPDDSELVSQLQDVFTRRYGHRLPSLRIGGGTYARNLPNAVSFGPLLPGKPDQCHMSNESMSLADFFFQVKVISDAIAVLATYRGSSDLTAST